MIFAIVMCALSELFLLQFLVALVKESREALHNRKSSRSAIEAGDDADLAPAKLYSGEGSCRI
jgi:hypothetical protein